MFEIEKINKGITEACKVMDELGLTLLERWWVFSHLEQASRAILGSNAEKTLETLTKIREKWLAEVPVESGGVGGVGDGGDDGPDESYDDNDSDD